MKKPIKSTLVVCLLVTLIVSSVGMGASYYYPINNSPPNKPETPDGEDQGNPDNEYLYWTYTTDPDQDKLSYGWNWTGQIGNDPLTIDQWEPPEGTPIEEWFDSGETCTIAHTWNGQGEYEVRAIAKDQHGAMSEWSDPFSVTMPVNQGILSEIIDFIMDFLTCFTEGSRITMADGSYKNIEDIEVGDIVKAYDLIAEEFVDAEVIKVYHHEPEEMTDHYLIINDKLGVTPNHLFYVNDELVPAGELKEGDVLTSDSASEAEVTSLDMVFNQVTTYNFEITPLGENYGVTTGYGYIVENLIAYPYKFNSQQYQSYQQSQSQQQTT